jgi:ATP-dependent exoDNAse (exonuclease V) beta subunit
MKISKDGLVVFDNLKHTYTHKDGTVLQGVTTFISKHKKKFDAENIAINYAKKNGLYSKYWIDKWKYKGDISKVEGSAVHSIIENYVLNSSIDLFGISKKELIAKKFIEDYFFTKKLIPVEVEYLIYDLDIGLASQIDCIVKNNEGDCFILDWKTNSEIKTNSFQNQKLANPFSDYLDCDYYSYSLQLGIYKLLCKEYKIKDCYIIHIGESNYKFIKIYDKANLGALLGMGRF